MAPNRESRGAFGALAPDELRRLGRFAGFLLVVSSAAAFPARLFLEPAPEVWEHLVGLGSALVGVAFLLAPWERMSPGWLHAGILVATAEIAAGVGVLSDDYAFLFVLVAMFTAYAVRDRSVLLAYMLLFTLALLAPLAYANGELKEQAHHILVTLPVLLVATVIVRYLRDTLERRQQQYRRFAIEAVSLAERIRGHGPVLPSGNDLEERLGRLTGAEPEQEETVR